MAETAVLVDLTGHALGPAVAWYDRRADADVEQMERALTREEVDRQTGLGVGPIPTVVMLRWLMRAHPELRKAARCSASPSSSFTASAERSPPSRRWRRGPGRWRSTAGDGGPR